MSETEIRLRDIAVSRSAETCTLTWSDGEVQSLSLETLRQLCPCATCSDARVGGQPLSARFGAMPSSKLLNLENVGAYALRFHWADGHSAGIYSYDYLRNLSDA